MILLKFAFFYLSSLLLLTGCGQPVEAQQTETATAPADTSLAITYIANAGVLISAAEGKVLIDALHRPYLKEYITTPDSMIAQMMAGQPPFDGVDVMIVSHIHGDHFHSATVAEYLARQPGVRLVGPPEVKDSLREASADFGAIEAQIHTAPSYVRYDTSSVVVGAIQIEIFNMPHSGSEEQTLTQNIATLTTIGGRRILHTGDPGFEEKPVRAFGFQERDIDIGLLPDWFLAYQEGAELVKKYIQPKTCIGVHVSPQWMEANRERAARFFPDAVLLAVPGQVVLR